MYAIPVYIVILLFTIVIDYFAGIMIENAVGPTRKWFLVLSLVANIGILAFFKYYNFLAENLNLLLHIAAPAHNIPLLNIILPIGLSFHTFQAMSYTIEVYRGNHKAERHFGIYALYVMFYPQLVAGPIERPQNVLYQFHEKHKLEYNNLAVGIRLMLWGMIKKVVVADRLALITDPIFDHPHNHTGVTLAIGAIFFAFQIYCDFSGYSDIALGAARVMGFNLMVNFNHPYLATTISDFWRRWHISLSTWFRDYLYISLGGNRVSFIRKNFNLFFVFLISGLWHGANWTFIIWGALHGFYLVFASLTISVRQKINDFIGLTKIPVLYKLSQQMITFVLVTLAWVFFRANTVKDAGSILYAMHTIPEELLGVIKTHRLTGLHLPSLIAIIYGVLLIIVLQLASIIEVRYNFSQNFSSKPAVFRWSIYYLVLFILFYWGVYDQHRFIYFQF